jgi:hypothetical protein
MIYPKYNLYYNPIFKRYDDDFYQKQIDELRDKIKAFEEKEKEQDSLDTLIIQLKNKTYHDEFYQVDFNIQLKDRFDLNNVNKIMDDSFLHFITFPFLSERLVNYIKDCVFKKNETRTFFDETLRYFKKLTFFYSKQNLSDYVDYNVFDHYTIFWIFNNINLTIRYVDSDRDKFAGLIKTDLINLINKCKSLLGNNYNKIVELNNFLNDITTNNNKIKETFEFLGDIFSNISEDNKRQLSVFISMCVAEQTNNLIDQNISLVNFNDYFENAFYTITLRDYHEDAAEECIHIFN